MKKKSGEFLVKLEKFLVKDDFAPDPFPMTKNLPEIFISVEAGRNENPRWKIKVRSGSGI